MIRQVWKLNVCTVLLLPLLNEVTKGLLFKNKAITFTQMAFLYNFKNCYLDDKLLAIVFDKQDCLRDVAITKTHSIHLSEYLASLKYFHTFEIINDVMIFYFDLNLSKDDLNNIRISQYSKLSEEFSKRVDVSAHHKSVVITKIEIADFLSSQNVARAIIDRESFMKELIEDDLKVKLPRDAEYFKKFLESKELLNKNNYK
jgi:hypothetical protein